MVWVGLSGGVDSAVAALLLKQRWHAVRGVFMQNWQEDAEKVGEAGADCHSKEDMLIAAAVADKIGIDFDVLNFSEEYRQAVFSPFIRDLQQGLTPNPDIYCNAHIKFASFANAAMAAGASGIATGHYAKKQGGDSEIIQLLKGEDGAKDQSYFLYRLNQTQLKRAVFPLGNLHKTQVRAIAKNNGLSNWDKKDSTGICFIGKRHFGQFIGRYIRQSPGEIQDENGRVVGEHQGLSFYTIGQRQGLNIGGQGAAWYVAAKDITNNILVVVQGADHPHLLHQELKIIQPHWVAGTPPAANWVFSARLRHQQPPVSCTLTDITAHSFKIYFAEPQRIVAAGQHAVIYDGNVCLGGGVLETLC